MSEERKIKMVIDPLGNPRIEAIGFHGQGCADATRAIQEALANGAGNVETVFKPEWHETEDVQHVVEGHTGC